jgi:hypothetical protein
LKGQFQGLSKEIEENTNTIFVELNPLEKVGLLISELQGLRKLYYVNTLHSLLLIITSIERKVSGIDALVYSVVENLPALKQVCICCGLAHGIKVDRIEQVLVGMHRGLSDELYKLIGKDVYAQI